MKRFPRNVDREEVWNVIEFHLPGLGKVVEELLKS
jgi:uncharacterized protein with HEPN domain